MVGIETRFNIESTEPNVMILMLFICFGNDREDWKGGGGGGGGYCIAVVDLKTSVGFVFVVKLR